MVCNLYVSVRVQIPVMNDCCIRFSDKIKEISFCFFHASIYFILRILCMTVPHMHERPTQAVDRVAYSCTQVHIDEYIKLF